MRTVLLILLQVFIGGTMAQNAMEEDIYVSDNSVVQTYGLPTVRSVGGGTKLLASYEGEWSDDMKGAFEYACKIWEEAMPTTFPIRIKVVLDNHRNTTALSKVSTQTQLHSNSDPFSYPPLTDRSTWLQMKATTFAEYTGQYSTHTYDRVLTMNMLDEPDITLTYYNKNNRLKNNCSFSLSETIDHSKYDFVTLALRDLAKSFGLLWVHNNPRRWVSDFKSTTPTPYELYILNELDYNEEGVTQEQLLAKATQGRLTLHRLSQPLHLYAPTTWDTQKSLSYFIPNDHQKITKLLSYDFGRGSVIRDINDAFNHEIFRNLLHWRGDVLVGFGNGNSTINESSQTTDQVIGYRGNIVLAQSPLLRRTLSHRVFKPRFYSPHELYTTDSIARELIKYHPAFDGKGNISPYGGTVSLLLNDGSWDVVYTYEPYDKQSLSFSDFQLHHSNHEYARTTDGYLRCRLTVNDYDADQRKDVAFSHYYAIDYLPQAVAMAKSGVLEPEDEEDYYRDVEIAYKNIEGVSRIVVSQYDEGEKLPLQYAVPDVKSGKFIATVDREYTTTFILTSYNKNGATTSERYVLPPLTPINELALSFHLNNEAIDITSQSRRMKDQLLIASYEVAPLDFTAKKTLRKRKKATPRAAQSNTIDISSLSHGIYYLHVTDVFGKKHSFKFIKQ